MFFLGQRGCGTFFGAPPQELRDLTGYTVWQEIAEIGVTRYFFIIAWASLYLALGYAREVGEAERTTSRYAQAAQDAELRSLRYQVNPHFLFNTLNSLSSLVIKGEKHKASARRSSVTATTSTVEGADGSRTERRRTTRRGGQR